MRRLSSHWLARFRRRRQALAVGVALPTIALVAGITAFAYWTTTGSGDASASVGTLDSTTIATHEATGTSVALAWDAVVPPDPDTVEYYVLRDDAPAGGSCGTACVSDRVSDVHRHGSGKLHAYVLLVRGRGGLAVVDVQERRRRRAREGVAGDRVHVDRAVGREGRWFDVRGGGDGRRLG